MTEHTTNGPRVSRRRVLAGTGGTAGLWLLAGCIEDIDDDDDGEPAEADDADDTGTDDIEETDDADAEDDDAYVVGMVDSLTGSLAPYGERNQAGLELAVEDINAVGVGPDDRELEVIVEDSETRNEAGVSAAQRLVQQEGVPILIAAVGSGVSMAIHDSVVEDADVVQISQNSTGAVLSEAPDLLRTSPSGAAKGAALADLIADEGHDSVAVTWVNNDYGLSLSEVFESEFDGEVAYNEPHEEGDASYSGELSGMADSGADAWLFITYADEFIVFVNEAFDQGYHEEFQYYGAESTIADTIIENTEPGSHDGMMGVTESAPLDQESYQEFESRFEEEFGETPTVWSAYTYDAITLSAIAIEAAGEFDAAAIEAVIRDVTRPEGEEVFSFEEAKEVLAEGGADDVDYQGVSGPIDLDENGDPTGFYQIYSVEDHDYAYGEFLEG